MSREIEKAAGIPVVQIATIVPIMMTVGSNRIVPGVAIPHPVGKPELGDAEDKKARRKLLEKALEAMVTPIDKSSPTLRMSQRQSSARPCWSRARRWTCC